MLLNNNPQLDTKQIAERLRRRQQDFQRVPQWVSERDWLKSLDGEIVALGSSRQRRFGQVNNYAGLLSLPTPAFIEESCYYLTGELPDYARYHEHLAALLAGEEREKWLLRLAKQPPLSANSLTPPPLPGLKKGLAKARLKYLPKVGRLVRLTLGILKLDEFLSRMQHFTHLQDARYDALLELHRKQAQTLAELQTTQEKLAIENQTLAQQIARQDRTQANPTAGNAHQGGVSSQESLVTEDSHANPERDFYLALEGRFRGSLSAIGELMKEHLPLVASTQPLQQGKALLDLGCGRGEWLALVKQQGYHAWGVDLNANNVKITRQRGLDVRYEDALTTLANCDDDSIGMITSFHLVEHLSHEQLRTLLREALRALAPEGKLLLETPNPQNLLVGSCNFYLDPTHVRPIPPDFMQFLAEYTGFEHADIIPLHPVDESLHLPDEGETSRRVNHYLYGPQDYAMLATKAAASKATDHQEATE